MKMYHTADIKKWFHHLHMPGHETLGKIEHFFVDKRFLKTLGVIALIAFVFLVLFLAVKYGSTSGSGNFYSSYPSPFRP
jgi:hypothetical protein